MVQWGVIGAGTIARVFCNGMRFSKSGRIAALASRSRERAAALADPFAIPKRFDDYEALLADPEVDAVYVSTIHPAHAEWAPGASTCGVGDQGGGGGQAPAGGEAAEILSSLVD